MAIQPLPQPSAPPSDATPDPTLRTAAGHAVRLCRACQTKWAQTHGYCVGCWHGLPAGEQDAAKWLDRVPDPPTYVSRIEPPKPTYRMWKPGVGEVEAEVVWNGGSLQTGVTFRGRRP